MAKYIVDGEDLTGIADAIREKTDSEEPIVFPDGFINEIGLLNALQKKTISTAIPTQPYTIDPHEQIMIWSYTITGLAGIKRFRFLSGYSDSSGLIYSYSLYFIGNDVTFRLYMYNSTTNAVTISNKKYSCSLEYYL